MSQPFLAEIKIFGFNFAPKGWAFCNGQLLPIQQNTAVFSLVGTFYGGNGTTNFGLPNLQGQGVVHQGQGPGLSSYVVGETTGVATVTLNQNEMPLHTHQANAIAGTTNGDASATPGGWFGKKPYGGHLYYDQPPVKGDFDPSILGTTGGSQPHENMQPYLAMSFCIALLGIFPSRN